MLLSRIDHYPRELIKKLLVYIMQHVNNSSAESTLAVFENNSFSLTVNVPRSFRIYMW